MTELSPRDDLKSEIRLLLVCLVKLALAGDRAESRSWRSDALRAQQHLAPGAADTGTLNLDSLWTMAVKTAESDPVVRNAETVNPILPTMSPLGLADLEAAPFDLDAAVQRIRDVASFG